MFELLGLVTVWGLLTGGAIFLSVKRGREFEGALAARGFVTLSPAPALGDVFRRPGAAATRVVTGMVRGVPAIFVFGSRPGSPPPIEGTFVNLSIPIVAVLLGAANTRAGLERWTDQRAYGFGWRPAYAAEVMSDGWTLLAWDHFGQHATDFDSCCNALVRSWTEKQGPTRLKPVQRPH